MNSTEYAEYCQSGFDMCTGYGIVPILIIAIVGGLVLWYLLNYLPLKEGEHK